MKVTDEIREQCRIIMEADEIEESHLGAHWRHVPAGSGIVLGANYTYRAKPKPRYCKYCEHCGQELPEDD